jgi:type IV secretory pathway VirB3-like protein
MGAINERQHAVPVVLNRAMTLFGVPRVLFFAAAGIAAGVFIFTWSLLLAVPVVVLLSLLSYYMTADDPSFPAILWSGLRMTAIYDPLVRKESVIELVDR